MQVGVEIEASYFLRRLKNHLNANQEKLSARFIRASRRPEFGHPQPELLS